MTDLSSREAGTLTRSTSEDELGTAAGLISAIVSSTVFATSEPILLSRFAWIAAALPSNGTAAAVRLRVLCGKFTHSVARYALR
jgi:hypothetical protein